MEVEGDDDAEVDEPIFCFSSLYYSNLKICRLTAMYNKGKRGMRVPLSEGFERTKKGSQAGEGGQWKQDAFLPTLPLL